MKLALTAPTGANGFCDERDRFLKEAVMNCYICDEAERAKSAVAICQHCGVGLCREHLDQDLLAVRVHGLVRRPCTHSLVHGAQRRRKDPRPPTAAPK